MKNFEDIEYDINGKLYLNKKLIKVSIHKKSGYPYVLIDNKMIHVKRLIFLIAGIDVTNKVVVNLNGIKTDNHLDNLELMTGSESSQYHFDQRQKRKNNERKKR